MMIYTHEYVFEINSFEGERYMHIAFCFKSKPEILHIYILVSNSQISFLRIRGLSVPWEESPTYFFSTLRFQIQNDFGLQISKSSST